MKHLVKVEGAIMLVIVLSYCGITAFCLYQWNDHSGAVITGFVLFAQSTCRRFFDWLQNQKPETNGGTNESVVAKT